MPELGPSGSVRGAPGNGRPYRDTLSGRMREICTSGCVSSEGWHVQQGIALPGQESGAP
jgi:hypothetical protein